MLVLVEVLAVAFGLANGVHDAGNAISAPVMTRSLRPGAAVALAAVFHVIGALSVGVAVAATVAGIVDLAPDRMLPVLAAALTGALVWNLATLWRGLPCSSGHCLVGALAGAAIADAGLGAVRWGGMDGIRPVGVFGVLIWLALSAVVVIPLAGGLSRLSRRLLRRAPASATHSVRRAEWGTSAALAFAHGSNDAQKTMGVMAVGLVAGGQLHTFGVPLWVALVSAGALTAGTSLGGWRVVRTLGRRIYPISALDGLVSQSSSAGVVLAASLAGAPVSTSTVVAPSVVGVGAGARWHHVRLPVVREIGLAWLVTLPVSGLLAAAALPAWRALA